MKFSEIKNPQAAAKAIEDFKKRFSSKECLAPDKNCGGPIVSAHTLSAESMLRPVSRDGHVYTLVTNLYQSEADGPTKIGLLGIRNTSVFNGFCSRHDKALFSPIEDRPFECSKQQLFLHAYRAISKESYLKRKQADSLPTPGIVKEMHDLPDDMELEYSEDALLLQMASLRGADEIERIKATMDGFLLAEDWNRLITTVIPFQIGPSVICSFVYSPDYDFAGNYLQDFEDLDVDLSQLFVTIIPSQNCSYAKGYALLTYLDTANSAPRNLVKSLSEQADVTSALLSLVFYQTENYAISPGWYEALEPAQKKAIHDAFKSNIDLTNLMHNQLSQRKLIFDSWLPGLPFQL